MVIFSLLPKVVSCIINALRVFSLDDDFLHQMSIFLKMWPQMPKRIQRGQLNGLI